MQRTRDLVWLESELLRASELSIRERMSLAWARYRAMARDAGRFEFLGHTLHYDNRLMPAMMPGYLSEIRRLDRLVGLRVASVLDIGANIGQFGATISWRFPEARVWSFEPNPEIYPLLERNAAQSSGWQATSWGIGEHDERAQFWFVPGKSAQGSVVPGNAVAGLRGGGAERRTVELRRLTVARMTALDLPPVIDLVKVDVEGAEREALLGLAAVRWRFLAIETSLTREAGLRAQDAIELVERIWERRPSVVWRGTETPGASVLDIVLALPQPN